MFWVEHFSRYRWKSLWCREQLCMCLYLCCSHCKASHCFAKGHYCVLPQPQWGFPQSCTSALWAMGHNVAPEPLGQPFHLLAFGSWVIPGTGSSSLKLALLSWQLLSNTSHRAWRSCQERVQYVLELWATHKEILPIQVMKLADILYQFCSEFWIQESPEPIESVASDKCGFTFLKLINFI